MLKLPLARVIFVLSALVGLPRPGAANPYLARPGEPTATVYVATCAVSGGFIQLYTAIDNQLFDKYGIAVKHVVIRGGTNINLAALGTDEVQFLYCAADSTLPGMAAGRDATLIASPLVGLPYVVIARKEIRSVQDLKGKSIGVASRAEVLEAHRRFTAERELWRLRAIEDVIEADGKAAFQFADLNGNWWEICESD